MHSGKAAADTQLPILTLAEMVHPLLAWICALFLLCAMLGAAMSVFTPVPRYFSRFERIRKHKTLFSAVLGLAAWAGSQLGFGSLISVLYPVYGYIAFAVIAMLLIDPGLRQQRHHDTADLRNPGSPGFRCNPDRG